MGQRNILFEQCEVFFLSLSRPRKIRKNRQAYKLAIMLLRLPQFLNLGFAKCTLRKRNF